MSFSSTNTNAHNSNNNDDNMANSSSDFVSADVNEVLQDARRQNLTNREQQRDGQHSNDLDESTTVQVTKQDSDGGPLEVTVEEAETEERVSGTSTKITMDLPMNCEIFKCLKLPIQKKFIWGLGRDIYGMFGQKLLKKTKRVRNPHGNRWNGANTRATVAANGLSVSIQQVGAANVFAEQSFPISGPLCRADEFPGTICYYYEVKGRLCDVGLTNAMPHNSSIGGYSNSYAIHIVGHNHCYGYYIAGEPHLFELPEGAIRPEMKCNGNVFGCGLVLDPDNKLAIFFTLNGQLLGRKISITPTVDRLFPSVTMVTPVRVSFEANFGDNPANPFEYDIKNCPGLELACI